MPFYYKCVKIIHGEFETILTKPRISVKKQNYGEKTMKKQSTLYLTRGALIAALYVALTYAAALFGLSSGAIQFRISEALTILPIFLPEAVPGLTVGCLIANLISGGVFWDVIFGTLATFIGALGAGLIGKVVKKHIWLATLPTVISNMLIVPPVLIFAYGVPDAYIYLVLTVGIGEIVCAGVLGTALGYSIKKSNFFENI